MSETRYLVPRDRADWAVWDGPNGVLVFVSDGDVLENYRENLEFAEEMGEGQEIRRRMLEAGIDADSPSAEQAWNVIGWVWEGDVGGRMWHLPVPEGATWIALTDGEDDTGMPTPAFHSGEPPLSDGVWQAPGY